MSRNKITIEMLKDLIFEHINIANEKLTDWNTGLAVRFISPNSCDAEVYDPFTGLVVGSIRRSTASDEMLQTGDAMSQSGEAMTSGDDESGYTHIPEHDKSDVRHDNIEDYSAPRKSVFDGIVKDDASDSYAKFLEERFRGLLMKPASPLHTLLKFYAGTHASTDDVETKTNDTNPDYTSVGKLGNISWGACTPMQINVKGSEPETVKAESNARVVNNVMRHEYRVLSDSEKELMRGIKDAGLAFITLLGEVGGRHETGSSRELSIAKTKIEEAVMWAVRDLTA
jgi:hypothetical protein